MQTSSNSFSVPETLSQARKEQFKHWLSEGSSKPGTREARLYIESSFRVKLEDRVVEHYVKDCIIEIVRERHEQDPGGNTTISLPGFGLPLDDIPDRGMCFPMMYGDDEDDWHAVTLLIREVCMLKLVEELSNKPEWWLKVRDDDIVAKWKKEALEMDWKSYRNFADFTPAMADACINELREKADIYEKTGLIPVMDYSACAIKSDSILDEHLVSSLKEAVKPLEEVPDDRKDWHPGSDDKVLDLVHPSLWPLLYGRSRILPDRTISLQNALEHCGLGVTIPGPDPIEYIGPNSGYRNSTIASLSSKFQWLPCDVKLDLETGSAKIDSYINNLHPVEHANLYPIIERFIEKSLPAWDVVLRWPDEFDAQRLKTTEATTDCTTEEACEDNYGCRRTNRPVGEDEEPRDDDEEYEEGYEGSERFVLDSAWFEETHSMRLPDAEPETQFLRLESSDIKTAGFFDKASRIQVIVKLANIHLTPENPTYDGGSWHTEGQYNEHIAATALYYYDSDNITDCRLDFRTLANGDDLVVDLNYEQGDNYSIERTFAIRPSEDILQDIGSVLTRPNRALFFPNLYQHHVSPFSLVDKARPGHRKILALFLVDPAIPIISTANVPPQQKHWWSGQVGFNDALGRLPPELANMVVDNVDFPIGEVEAKELRLQLMAERTGLQQDTEGKMKEMEWNFCEH